MENASKALIIAGAVLIAILVLTLGMYVFRMMADSSARIYSELEQSEISEFNQKFLNYDQRGIKDGDGKAINPLNVQDIATIIHLSQDNTKSGKLPTKVIVKVETEAEIVEMQDIGEDDINKLLQDNIDKEYYCKNVKINSKTELVELVEIELIT